MPKLTQKQKRAQEKKRRQKHNAAAISKKKDIGYQPPASILESDYFSSLEPHELENDSDILDFFANNETNNNDEDDDEWDGYNLWSEEDKAIEREIEEIVNSIWK